MSATSYGSPKEFWAACREHIAVVNAECAASGVEYKPYVDDKRPGYCFIISLQVGNIVLPGQVSECTVKLAAQRIIEGSHRLCTVIEVQAWKAHHARQAAMLRQMEAARTKTTTMEVLK